VHALVSPPRAQAACIPDNENERLSVLRDLALLDTPPLAPFDRVTRLAAKALAVPIVLISLVDEKRQWFLSRVGLTATETSRDVSFCAHSVYECRPLIVSDATADARFADNLLVKGDPHIRAYAGIPIYTRSGYALGTLCAIDTCTRNFNDGDINVLRDCTFIVEDLIQARERALGSDRAARQISC
jgi:GAF domain-containing protein